MSTIYDPDARTVKQASIAIFLLTVTLGVMGPVSFSGGWWIYGCLSLAAFIYMFYIKYTCERYTLFASSYFTLLIFLLAFAPACVSYMVVTDDLGGTKLLGAAATLSILAFVMLVYLFIYLTPTKNFPFEVSGNKVSFSAPDISSFQSGIIAGAGTLVASVVIRSVTSLTTGILIILLFLFGCIFILIHSRHLIRGLRTLRIQEKTMPAPYTFMQIDDIREARRRWWLSRLFRWVASLRESSGA
ncbi:MULTISPECIES: hypothetical protein [Pseudomonas syringae group]|uniref:Uncharacterized protein n=3 Tax=Pseudomonas syringae group TaxID=136849 RepID=F3G8Y7_PSESJ|nr:MULTISPECIES: hypothetical protein [Pseudomonas syringae group]EGH43537.1 hypothetical protein PSYPI_14563 [Pseudomonas syringae pv. pisi str. 1704B]PYD09621.1 hypothetical protein DND62_21910 [Pseudomonas syringae pv. pisi]PYD27826.1 hypothetical protein DND67_22910 [Pseudomonas syringae pv. pisi]PYD28966.1 hypothetical protein DND58_22270 [Pseudomonas syringae pv. pisi]RML55380.1 putative membrane protein [Pseudomonas syringae pv. pisi]